MTLLHKMSRLYCVTYKLHFEYRCVYITTLWRRFNIGVHTSPHCGAILISLYITTLWRHLNMFIHTQKHYRVISTHKKDYQGYEL